MLASQTDVESTETDWKVLQIGDYESRIFSKFLSAAGRVE